MKKFLCVLCLLLALAAPVLASAGDFTSDLFSSMSVYDLLRARNTLSEELANRGYEEYVLSKGRHVVGEAISPGVYTLSAVNLLHPARILVKSADGEILSVRSVSYDWKYNEFTESKGHIQIELEEGQVIEVINDSVAFYQY